MWHSALNYDDYYIFSVIKCETLDVPGVVLPSLTAASSGVARCKAPGSYFSSGLPVQTVSCNMEGKIQNVDTFSCDRRCKPFPYLNHANAKINDDMTLITCHHGYKFPDGYRVKQAECDSSTGEWIIPDDAERGCICKSYRVYRKVVVVSSI